MNTTALAALMTPYQGAVTRKPTTQELLTHTPVEGTNTDEYATPVWVGTYGDAFYTDVI